MTSLTGVGAQQVGVVGICVFVVIAFIRGWLVPRAQHLEVVRDRDWWRAKSDEKDEVIASFVETARTANHVIGSIPQAAEISRSGGGSDEASPVA